MKFTFTEASISDEFNAGLSGRIQYVSANATSATSVTLTLQTNMDGEWVSVDTLDTTLAYQTMVPAAPLRVRATGTFTPGTTTIDALVQT